jgi:predicted DNA-binding protein (UPF0251 family)
MNISKKTLKEQEKSQRIALRGAIKNGKEKLLGAAPIDYIGGYDQFRKVTGGGKIHCYEDIIIFEKSYRGFTIKVSDIESISIKDAKNIDNVQYGVGLAVKDATLEVNLKDGQALIFHTFKLATIGLQAKLANAISYYRKLNHDANGK